MANVLRKNLANFFLTVKYTSLLSHDTPHLTNVRFTIYMVLPNDVIQNTLSKNDCVFYMSRKNHPVRSPDIWTRDDGTKEHIKNKSDLPSIWGQNPSSGVRYRWYIIWKEKWNQSTIKFRRLFWHDTGRSFALAFV